MTDDEVERIARRVVELMGGARKPRAKVDRAKVIEMIKAGVPRIEIARMFGCHNSRISQIAKEEGLSVEKRWTREKSEARKAAFWAMVGNGMTKDEACRQLGVSRSWAYSGAGAR